jgi:hypothetical protein
MVDLAKLDELIARVEKVTAELSIEDALTLWCMSAGCKLVEHRNGERGVDGYWSYHILTDDSGGRKNVIVPEWQLPDRSIDAALGLAERMLPGWDYGLDRDEGQFFATLAPAGGSMARGYQAEGSSLPLAIILALLKALRESSERGR